MIKKLLMTKIVGLMLVGTCQADRIQDFAQAVARAEGFYQKGSIPSRYRNPGDLKVRRGEKYPGQVGIGKKSHVIFRTDAAGWAALRHQIEKVLDGSSRVYTVHMTILQVAKKYAGDYRRWAGNVARTLGIKPTETLSEYFTDFEGAPWMYDLSRVDAL